MKKIKVKMSWARFTRLQQAAFARGTVSAMTGNANFTTPAVALTAMVNAASRLENAWANKDNGAVARDELNNAATDLDTKLHAQAEYVDNIANGNDDIIHTAGFMSTKPFGGRFNKIAAPTTSGAPIITSLAGGKIKVVVDAVANTRVYCFVLVVDGAFNVAVNNGQLEIATGTNAIIINSTKRSAVFQNLPAMKSVQVAVVTINSSGTGAMSAVVAGSTIV